MKFRIRVDDYGIGAKTSLYDIIAKATEYVLVHHQIGDNPHWHLYVDNPNYMSCQAVRYHLRKNTDNPTNYSVKKCDDDRKEEYIQYMFNTKHGNIPTLEGELCKTFNLEELQKNAQKVSEDFIERNKSKKAITLYDIAMVVDAECKSADDHLIRTAIKVLHRYLKVHDDYLIAKIVTTVLSKRNEEFVVERVRRKIFSQ